MKLIRDVFRRKELVFAISFLVIICLFFPNPAQCVVKPQTAQSFQQTKDPQIQQIKPKKPVKIKLKRSGKGEYSWELSGENVDDVVKADKRLRKLLEIE